MGLKVATRKISSSNIQTENNLNWVFPFNVKKTFLGVRTQQMDFRVRFSKPQLSEIQDFLVFNGSRFMPVVRKILKFCSFCHLKYLYLTVSFLNMTLILDVLDLVLLTQINIYVNGHTYLQEFCTCLMFLSWLLTFPNTIICGSSWWSFFLPRWLLLEEDNRTELKQTLLNFFSGGISIQQPNWLDHTESDSS